MIKFSSHFQEINKTHSALKEQNRTNKQVQNISFGSFSPSQIVGKKMLPFYLMALVAFASAGCGVLRTGYKNKEISKELKWNENTKVMAASSQLCDSYGDNYTKALLRKIKNPKFKGIEDANDYIVNHTYSTILKARNIGHCQTPNRKLNAWNKSDTAKQRFVLLIAEGDDKRFTKGVGLFKNKIKEIFNVPDSNFCYVSSPLTDSVESVFQKISDKINLLKDKSNIEFLMYYSGHGDVSEFVDSTYSEDSTTQVYDMLFHYPNEKKLIEEGALIGKLVHTGEGQENTLDEFQLKSFIDKYLDKPFKKKPKNLIIMDTCSAGAWIADAGKSSGKKSMAKTITQNIKRI